MTARTQQPFLNTRDDIAFQFFGNPTVVRATGEATNGAYLLLEHSDVAPGFGTPYHTHHAEDEAFYVLEGELAVVVDGKWSHAKAGTYVFGPRDIPHGFKVVGNTPARMLLMCSPAGFERFVMGLKEELSAPPAPPDMQKMMALAAECKIDIHGPLPEEA